MYVKEELDKIWYNIYRFEFQLKEGLMDNLVNKSKEDLIIEIQKRVEDKIIEKSNADLIIKLIQNADSLSEAITIAQLGTTYKRTGFHFDKRLEEIKDTIKYFKRNEKLSFKNDNNKLTHKLIIGDNYDALLNLLIEYKNKIDVIYIDPPYGKDDMGEFAEVNYYNAITRDNLLSMLYSRLQLARQLLSENGFIICSIDDKNYAYVKCLFDEVFNEKHFINTFVWKKNSSGKTEKEKYTINTEYLLLYAKTAEYELSEVFKPLAAATKALYKNDDGDGRGKYRLYPLQKPSNPGPETTYDYIDNNGKIWPCPPKGWRMKQSKLKALENDNRLCLINDTLSEKAYWNERKSDGKRIDTLWDDLSENSVGTKELEKIVGKNKFDNPKPVDLIKRCINIGNDDAIVLDFFAGSGTTGQAVLELNREDGGNRQFILCTNNEITDKNPNGIAYDVTSKRLKRIMTGECYDGTKDFDWIKNNKPYEDNLDVYDIEFVSNFESAENKTPFDVIDETLYGVDKFNNIKDKIDWVCNNFEHTQKVIESDDKWRERVESKEC